MRIASFILSLALAGTSPAFAAGQHSHEPVHGGVVVETRDLEIELVAKPDSLQLYLRDHGKAVDVSKATAKLTLLAGQDKQEVTLNPVGDKLEAKGNFKLGAGIKAIAVVKLPGKPVTARFVLK